MTHIYKYLVSVAVASLGLLSSCTRTEDPTFATTPSERIEASLHQVQSALIAPSNGWVARIYPSGDQKWGGYTVLLKFSSDGRVQAANELLDPSKTYSSYYTIDNSILTSINFDTENKAIHLFAEPNLSRTIAEDKQERGDESLLGRFAGASSNRGLEGDNSFQVVSVAADRVVLRGMHSQSLAVLTPAPAESWQNQLEAIQAASKAFVMPRVQLSIGGKTYMGRMNALTRQLRLLDDNNEVVLNSAFVYTAKGLELYQPFTLDGVSVQNFSSSSETNVVLSSGDGKAKLEPRVFAISELIADTKELWSVYSGGEPTAQMSGRFQEGFDKFNEVNAGKYMLLDVDFGASEYPGFTDFGMYAVAMELETGMIFIAYLPIKVTVDSPTELTFVYEPSRILSDQARHIEESLARLMLAGFSGLGQVKAADGSFLYNEELKSRSFRVTTNDLVKTEWIRLEDKSNPDNWIKLNRALVVGQ
ncbi:MAG: DUF4302 domain-containing protein [Porphyromonas sp.]|nr:DUF4302 domain-containing protein [Porphyromonas sp.]